MLWAILQHEFSKPRLMGFLVTALILVYELLTRTEVKWMHPCRLSIV